MSFKSYRKMLIVNQPIRNIKAADVTVGYEFKLQYPSYRGTFLSCIEELVIKVDDQEIPKQDVSFLINDKQFLLDELPECFKEYWFVLDFATIRVIKVGGLTPGEHKVNVYMRHRVPYTGYFGQYLTLVGDETRMLPVEE